MNILVALGLLIAGAVIGGWLMWWVTRTRVGAQSAAILAAAETERDVLRERVVDLEATVSDDAQTAALLGPLRDALGRVERQVTTLERDRVEQFGSVDAALKAVTTSTQDLKRETASLAGSLNASSVRGRWGEAQLRRILELSGMLKRCDFDEQWRGHNDDGQAVRPDVVVHLPGDRQLVIDAKAPLTAFLSAQDVAPAERKQALNKHAKALRGHVDALSAKRYWSALPHAPAFTICFVPGDAILAAALDADTALLDDAMSRGVILASPSTLLATMRSVAALWQAEHMAENARELLSLGRELYDRIGVLARHTNDLGSSLRRSVEAYNLFVGSFESRVLVTARRLEELEAAHGKSPSVTPIDAAPRPFTHEAMLVALDDETRRTS